MTAHACGLARCDGTRLGHELARDFPKETARINEAFEDAVARFRGDRVRPEALQVEEWPEANSARRLIDETMTRAYRELGDKIADAGFELDDVVSIEVVQDGQDLTQNQYRLVASVKIRRR